MFKNLLWFLCLFLMSNTSILIAGCGGCQINNTQTEKETSSTFIDNLPSNNKIDGFVIASCNKCNLGKINDIDSANLAECCINLRANDNCLPNGGLPIT